jgi:hedgehog/intein hint domain protein
LTKSQIFIKEMMERKNTGKHRNTVTLEDKMNAIKKCFTSETKILGLENKNISQIELYDKVYSFDEEKNKIELKQVVNLFKHKTNSTIELFLSNGEKISTTKEHKFYIQNKYIIAEDIKLDTKLFTVNNVEIKLLEKREIFYEKEIFVYNFEVEGNHNYFVGENGILVHNEKEFFDENNLDKLFDGEKLTPLGRELKDNKPKGSPEIKEWIERHSENNPKKYNKGGFFAVSDDRTKYLYGWDDNGDITLGMVDVNDGYTTISGHIGDPIKVPYASRNHNRDFGKFAEDIRENTKKIIEKDGINLAESKNEIYLKLTQSDKDDIIDYLREEGIVIHHARDNRDFDYTFEMQETKRHNANKGGVAHKGPQALDGKKKGE